MLDRERSSGAARHIGRRIWIPPLAFALLAGLDVEGICASAGAACSAGSLEPSHVVSALGLNRELSRSLVRFSLGRETTASEVEQVCERLPGIIRRAQGRP